MHRCGPPRWLLGHCKRQQVWLWGVRLTFGSATEQFSRVGQPKGAPGQLQTPLYCGEVLPPSHPLFFQAGHAAQLLACTCI